MANVFFRMSGELPQGNRAVGRKHHREQMRGLLEASKPQRGHARVQLQNTSGVLYVCAAMRILLSSFDGVYDHNQGFGYCW